MKILNRILDSLRANREYSLLTTGALLSNQQWNMSSSNFNDYEFKIFSQWGDDGLIQYLIKHLMIKNETFVEFGVEDYRESNTRFLMMNNNWGGLVMDGSSKAMNRLQSQRWFWKYDLVTKNVFIDKENINKLLDEEWLEDIGLLHIDIDGNDYHILEHMALDKLNPSIIIMEYNGVLGFRPLTIPYQPDFQWTKAHYSNLYYGASVTALTQLANSKGYALVGTNRAGNNAYYVRRDLLNERIQEVDVKKGFNFPKFRQGRYPNGKLTYMRRAEQQQILKGMKFLNVETQILESF